MPLFASAQSSKSSKSSNRHSTKSSSTECGRSKGTFKSYSSGPSNLTKIQPKYDLEQELIDDHSAYFEFERDLSLSSKGKDRKIAESAFDETLFWIDKKGSRDILLYGKFYDLIPDYIANSLQAPVEKQNRISCAEFAKACFEEPKILNPEFQFSDSPDFIKLVDWNEQSKNESSLNKAILVDESSAQSWIEFLLNEHNHERRLAICQKAVDKFPFHVDLNLEYLSCFCALKDLKEQINEWVKVLDAFSHESKKSSSDSPTQSLLLILWEKYLHFRATNSIYSDWLIEAQKGIKAITEFENKLQLLKAICRFIYEFGYCEKAVMIILCQVQLILKENGADEIEELLAKCNNLFGEADFEELKVNGNLICKWLQTERFRNSKVFCVFEEDPHSQLLYEEIQPFLFVAETADNSLVLDLLNWMLFLTTKQHLLSLEALLPSFIVPSQIQSVENAEIAKRILDFLCDYLDDEYLYSLTAILRIKLECVVQEETGFNQVDSKIAKRLLKRRETPLLWIGYCVLTKSIPVYKQLKSVLADKFMPLLHLRMAEIHFLNGSFKVEDFSLNSESDCCALILNCFVQFGFDFTVQKVAQLQQDESTKETATVYFLSIAYFHFYSRFPSNLRIFYDFLFDALRKYPTNVSLLELEKKAVSRSMILPKNMHSRLRNELPLKEEDGLLRLLVHLVDLALSTFNQIHLAKAFFVQSSKTLYRSPAFWSAFLSFLQKHEFAKKMWIYEAIKNCPWQKELYLTGIEMLEAERDQHGTEKEQIEFVNVMEEKELRIRTLIEEFEDE